MDKRKSKQTLFQEKLDKFMLLKVGKSYKISGGGIILQYFKYLAGSWKKLEKEQKKRDNKGCLEEIKQFRNQERKYGITVKPIGDIKGKDIPYIEWGYIQNVKK